MLILPSTPNSPGHGLREREGRQAAGAALQLGRERAGRDLGAAEQGATGAVRSSMFVLTPS